MIGPQNTWVSSPNKRLMSEFLSGMERFSEPLRPTVPPLSPRERPAIARHLKLFQLFGSTPLLNEPPNFSRISKRALTLTLIFGILHVAHLLDPNVSWRREGKFTKYVIRIAYGFLITTPFLITYDALRKRFQLENVLNNLIGIQGRLGASEYKMFGSTAAVVLLNIGFEVGLVLFRLAVILFTEEKSLLWVWDDAMWLAYYTYMFSSSIKITYLLKCVGACFSRLSITYLSGTRSEESMNSFVKTYSQLVDIVEELNVVFDVTMTTFLLNTYVVSLEMTTEIFIGSNSLWWEQIGFFAWLPIPMIGAYHMFDTCHKLTNQAEECNAAFVNNLIFHEDDSLRSNPLVMIHLSGKKTVIVRFCDCFIVDYSFGISMIAAFLTYIMVLYQMEKDASTFSATTALRSNSSS